MVTGVEDKKLIKGIDYIGVTVVFLCHDGKGNIVMAKRSKNARDEQGRWDIGGGGLDFGSSPEETLKKEILEEYCTDVLNFEFLGFRDAHRELNDRPTHWIALDYLVLVDPYKVKIGEPHKFDDIGFYTLDNLPEPLHSQFPIFLNQYKDRLREILNEIR